MKKKVIDNSFQGSYEEIEFINYVKQIHFAGSSAWSRSQINMFNRIIKKLDWADELQRRQKLDSQLINSLSGGKLPV